MTERPSEDYQRTIRVRARPEALFDALTTVSGLAAWWTRATGSGGTGGELRFLMDSPGPCVIHVDEATRPASVRWTVTECRFLPDWVGTRPAFTITPVDAGTSELRFRHHGLTPELDCVEMCTRGWNHYLASLREYVETGHGSPHGSSGDRARRAREARPGAVLGNHSAVRAPRTEQERIRRFYRDVLGCTITRESELKDDFRLGDDFYIAFLYEDAALEESGFLRSMFLELKTDDVEEMRRGIVAFGVTVIDVPDPHLYFHAPGGQVFRLAGTTEDLSKYEGTAHGERFAEDVFTRGE